MPLPAKRRQGTAPPLAIWHICSIFRHAAGAGTRLAMCPQWAAPRFLEALSETASAANLNEGANGVCTHGSHAPYNILVDAQKSDSSSASHASWCIRAGLPAHQAYKRIMWRRYLQLELLRKAYRALRLLLVSVHPCLSLQQTTLTYLVVDYRCT